MLVDLFIGSGWRRLGAARGQNTRLVHGGSFGRMMTRTTILVNKLIILALHGRMETLIGGNVLALRSTSSSMVLRAAICSTLLIVTAHVRRSLVTWPMRLNRVLLLLMVQVFAIAHAWLVVEVFGALA